MKQLLLFIFMSLFFVGCNSSIQATIEDGNSNFSVENPPNDESEEEVENNITQGVGRFCGGVAGAAVRGGNSFTTTQPGLFTIYFSYSAGSTRTDLGFRCVRLGS
ncbi:MAG: hypothetical protein H6621_08140 [Halobacteriovoraceae bacterium]|nr:hypothetical protein [Halobacteriovoraceae bacterium]